MCYRDRTYCPFWESCVEGKECPRALTSEIIEGANKFGKECGMDGGFPISRFANYPDCYVGE